MRRRLVDLNKLKGLLSRALTIKATLRCEDRNSLEKVFDAVDKYVLSDRGTKSESTFKKTLVSHIEVLEGTRRLYIKDKILPLMTDLVKEKE